jgi:hypothetical protein
VLWEQVEKIAENTWKASGLTDNYLRVDSEVNKDCWNSFSKIKIISLTSHGVRGRIIPIEQ